MSQTTKWIVGVIIAVVVVAVGYSVIKGPSAPKETGPIKIGLSSPMSGEAASYGEAFFGGAALAVKEINDAGGINGRKIELIVEDDKCSADGATAINKLANVDKVTAIVGPLCSAAAGPGAPIAQNAGVPSIIVASAPGLTKAGNYIFRDYPSDAVQGKFAAEFIYENLGKRKAAVIYVKNDWGQGIRDVFVKRFKELGGEVVYDESILQDSTDLRTQIAKAKAANPDALYFPVYPQNSVAGLKQISEMGLDAVIVGGDAFADDTIAKLPEAEGALYTVAKTNNPKDFQEKVKQASGKNPNVFTPYAYDAVKILAKVMEKAGADPRAIRDELAQISYKDAISLPVIEFDENGDLKTAEFEVKVVKNGKTEDYK